MDQQLMDEAQLSKMKPVAGLSKGGFWTCIDLQRMGASPAGLRSGGADTPTVRTRPTSSFLRELQPGGLSLWHVPT